MNNQHFALAGSAKILRGRYFMKTIIAAILITASASFADYTVVVPPGTSQEELNQIIFRVNANNIAEQNRILQEQTEILRESLERQEEILNQLENK
jgi:hypothetical protein